MATLFYRTSLLKLEKKIFVKNHSQPRLSPLILLTEKRKEAPWNFQLEGRSVLEDGELKPRLGMIMENFINGMRLLANGAVSSNDATKRINFMGFLAEFGTHYQKQTRLGANMIYEKRFSTRSKR